MLWEFKSDNKLCPINKAALIAFLGHLYGTVKFTCWHLARLKEEGSLQTHTVEQQCYFHCWYDCSLSVVSTDQSANEGSKVKAFSRTKGQFTTNSIRLSFLNARLSFIYPQSIILNPSHINLTEVTALGNSMQGYRKRAMFKELSKLQKIQLNFKIHQLELLFVIWT